MQTSPLPAHVRVVEDVAGTGSRKTSYAKVLGSPYPHLRKRSLSLTWQAANRRHGSPDETVICSTTVSTSGSTMKTRDPLSLKFTALAHPTRRAILRRLARGEATVYDIARPFHLSLPTVSKHLKVLRQAGLISQGRHAQQRPCRIEFHRLRSVATWFEPYQQLWDARLSRLDAHLRQLQARGASDHERRPRN